MFTFILHKDTLIPIELVLILYPIVLGITSIPKILPLRTDYTAERLGYDIIQTAPAGSLVLLNEDTRTFNTHYIYLTAPSRPNITVLNFGLLRFPFYGDYVRRHYPDIKLSDEHDAQKFTNAFFRDNAQRFVLYSDVPYSVDEEFLWIPMGLLYRLHHKNLAFDKDVYLSENNRVFAQYQDILKGALGQYKHVMLADTLRVYSNGRLEVGRMLVKLGFLQESQEYFRNALRLNPENPESLVELINSYMALKQCNQAEKVLQNAVTQFPQESLIFQMGTNLYKDCFNNDAKATEYEKRYEELLQKNQPSLKQL